VIVSNFDTRVSYNLNNGPSINNLAQFILKEMRLKTVKCFELKHFQDHIFELFEVILLHRKIKYSDGVTNLYK